ncbi:AraC family transcriptional regulator [Chitinophaga sp.]|uniref:helix-turn-helix domain-containing protein n=1 Tax=Chitinophaga sp. TaxID=1869181 RepID=UPI002F95E7F0
MRCTVTSASGIPLSYTEAVSENLAPYQIISQKNATARYQNGALLFQCIWECNDYGIWYNTFSFDKEDILISSCDSPKMILRVALDNLLNFELERLGDFQLLPGQFLLFYHPNPKSIFRFSGGAIYSMLDIAMPIEYLNHFITYYPVLNDFMDRLNGNDPVSLTISPVNATAVLLDCIDKLLHCNYMGSLRGMFADARIMDIMTEVFTVAHGSNRSEVSLTHEERQRIIAVKDLLSENLDTHYTIKDLSRMVYINEYKLKKGFQVLTGSSIFDYQLSRRIQVAQQWLRETDLSLEEIATATGYQYLSSFIAAFKQRVGITPAAYRKNGVF